MNFDNLKAFMDRLTETKVPGNAVTIYLNGKKVFSYASGYSDLENKTEMTGHELLNIYSCSKVTTVTAACQLLERGLILINDPLYDYIPEFREMYVDTPGCGRIKAKNKIKIIDLFRMSAGFDYNFNIPEIDEAYTLTKGSMDTLTVAKCLAKAPLHFEPGTKWNYSLCHDVLAALVSAVTGMKFRDYVKKNIFDPLEMTESYYHYSPEIEKRMANMYSFIPSGSKDFDIVEAQKGFNTKEGHMKNVGKTSNKHILGPEYDSGGAGIITSVPDYAKLTAALANGGVGINGERILSSRTVQLMKTDTLTEQMRPDYCWGNLIGYGYGLGVRTLINPALAGTLSPVGEFGWGGAAGATVLCDTQNRLAVFYAHHMLNPQEGYYQPRLRNVVYSCLDK